MGRSNINDRNIRGGIIMETFNKWYQENKNSEILRIEYIESVCDLPKEERPTFRQWCKARYEFEIRYQ